MRIRFVWGYPKPKRDWFAKEDSMQYCIRELTKNHDVTTFVTSDSNDRAFERGINWAFFKTSQSLVASVQHEALSKKIDVLISCGPGMLDMQLVKLHSHVKLIHYHPGDNPLPEHYKNFDMIFTHHPYQVAKLRAGFPKVMIRTAPHTPNLHEFKPNSAVPKKFDVCYPTRPHPLKRLGLLKQACAHGKFSLNISNQKLNYKGLIESYQSARCMATTSVIEGGSRIVVEALACNLPVVVCSDCLSNVAYAKRFGLFIAAPTKSSVAHAIKQAINSKINFREKLQKQKFDYPNMLANMSNGIHEVYKR